MASNSLPLPASGKRDDFGCQLAALDDDLDIFGSHIRFHRKKSANAPGQVATPESDRGFLVGVSLAGRHRRRIFHEHHSTLHDFDENSLYIRNFADPYKADLSGSFDFALMEIAKSDLEQIAEGADGVGSGALAAAAGTPDPILGGMVRALFSLTPSQQAMGRLLVDQLSAAIGLHLVHRYAAGSMRLKERASKLSKLEENRAKDLLRSNLRDGVSIDALASACNLSRIAFIRAFRASTGMSPHEWLMQIRMEQAGALLQTSQMPLTDIAASCGFASLQQFTRLFAQSTGAPPGSWRRAQQR